MTSAGKWCIPPSPVTVGYWAIKLGMTGVELHLPERPNWFRRKVVGWVTGWKWVDEVVDQSPEAAQ